LSTPKVSSFAQIGNDQTDAQTPPTILVTNAQAAESQITEHKNALEQKRLNARSPYKPDTWKQLLVSSGLITRYPKLPHQLQYGFDGGIPIISKTFTPPNKPSITEHLPEFNRIIQLEFEKQRYIGPLSKSEVETLIGPFQTSPLNIIPKPGKPGKFRIIQNLSHPHSPRNGISSINSSIDSDLFPSTWGTFSVICLLIRRLPPESQLAVRDVKEAYRTVPLAPSQWPGIVVRLHEDDSFAIDTRNCFGLASSSGCYGTIGDAGAQLTRHHGIGPVSKWVDDHVFIRILKHHLKQYNKSREGWANDIEKNGGEHHDGGRLWFKGATMPDDRIEEFDENCSTPILDLSNRTPRSSEDTRYSYSFADIDDISDQLGIPWEREKDIPFGTEAPFIGFLWNLKDQTVSIPEAKKTKYLLAIFTWESKETHSLEEAQKLYGKLLHACAVVPIGRAYLTSLEKFMAIFGNNPFMPHSPPRSTRVDLHWWKQTLSRPHISRSIPGPEIILDITAYSDASSEIGIGITIGNHWRSWRLLPGWKEDRRDIGWAEAIGFLFLILTILPNSAPGTHIKVFGDNKGVVEGWWKGRSRNSATNEVFKLLHIATEQAAVTIHTRYIPSKDNPADLPSRGIYGPKNLLLPPITIPHPYQQLVVNFDEEPRPIESRQLRNGTAPKPQPKPNREPQQRTRAELNRTFERRAEELFAQTQSWF